MCHLAILPLGAWGALPLLRPTIRSAEVQACFLDPRLRILYLRRLCCTCCNVEIPKYRQKNAADQ